MSNEEVVKVLKDLLNEVYYEDEPPKIGINRTRAIQIAIDIVENDNRIKCKDCKHFGTMRLGVECGGYCSKLEYTSREPHDFCSWAERKDNE